MRNSTVKKASWYMAFSNETIFIGISNVSAAIKFNKAQFQHAVCQQRSTFDHQSDYLFTEQFESLGLLELL